MEEESQSVAEFGVAPQEALLLVFRVGVEPAGAVLGDGGQRGDQFRVGGVEPPGPVRAPLVVGDRLEGVGADDARLQVGKGLVRRAGGGYGDEEAKPGDLDGERVDILTEELLLDDAPGGGVRVPPEVAEGALEREERAEEELAGADGGVEDPQFGDAVGERALLGVRQLRRRGVYAVEQGEQLRLAHIRGRGVLDGGGERVFHHFVGDVGGRVVGSLRLAERGFALLGGRDEPLEEVAEQLRVERLLAFAGAVLVHRPVVAGEDREEAGLALVRAPVRGGGEVEGVVIYVLGEKRPVEERRLPQRLV